MEFSSVGMWNELVKKDLRWSVLWFVGGYSLDWLPVRVLLLAVVVVVVVKVQTRLVVARYFSLVGKVLILVPVGAK
jgi:hypothetical protein